MPFMYLLSGGMSYRSFIPQSSYPVFFNIEKSLRPLYRFIAMFAFIMIEKVSDKVSTFR